MSRRRRPDLPARTDRADGDPQSGDRATPSPERSRPHSRETSDEETVLEGTSGEGSRASGTVPGSVGGTTGNTDRAAGAQAPGARTPTLPGIDPAKARGLVGRFKRSSIEVEEEEEDSVPPTQGRDPERGDRE